jgi:orotidine-5'-phosphate decarboxylase
MALEKIINYLNSNYANQHDSRHKNRSDIGNTSARYAKAFFFDDLNFDSDHCSLHAGQDSVTAEFDNKFAILLALTSNAGACGFQIKTMMQLQLIRSFKTASWLKIAVTLMYVVGATKTIPQKGDTPDRPRLVPFSSGWYVALRKHFKHGCYC